jgi:hypothetical protein
MTAKVRLRSGGRNRSLIGACRITVIYEAGKEKARHGLHAGPYITEIAAEFGLRQATASVRPRPVLNHDLVDDAEFLGLMRVEEVVALQRQLDLLDRLAGMGDIDLVQALAHAQNFAGVNFDIRRLALGAARRLMHHDAGVGSEKRLPLAPAASSSEPIEAAWPMQTVEMSGRMYCIVS